MIDKFGLEQCFSFINCQLQPPGEVQRTRPRPGMKMAITLSRQTGSGARAIAGSLANYLQAYAPAGSAPWTLFDRNLVEKVLEDHHLPTRLAHFMPEDRVPELKDMLEEALGVHPSASTLVQQTTDTILHLADLGNVILIGRGGNIVTARMKHVFHVRLVGTPEKRAERVMKMQPHLSHKAALALIQTEDAGRARYLKKHFGKDIDDPLLYDLVLNTDRCPAEEAIRLIGDAVLHRACERVKSSATVQPTRSPGVNASIPLM